MTDLDRKIAELKGWEITSDDRLGVMYRFESPIGTVSITAFQWSTSDAKAFELVDELAKELDGKDKDPGDVKIGVSLTRERGCGRWMAALCASNWVHGSGETRAEAICRAYIALKEWEGKNVAKG